MVKKATKKTIGVFSISIGLMFGILPLVPGILLIVVGLELLGLREATIEKLKGYWRRLHRKQVTAEVPTLNTPITPDPA